MEAFHSPEGIAVNDSGVKIVVAVSKGLADSRKTTGFDIEEETYSLEGPISA